MTQSDNHMLRTQNVARQQAWHSKQEVFIPWPKADWVCALGGEIGEALNEVKKLNRIKDGIIGDGVCWDQKITDLSFEIADCLIYLDLVCYEFGFEPEEFPALGAKRDQRNRKTFTASGLGCRLLTHLGKLAEICEFESVAEGQSYNTCMTLIRIYWDLYELADKFDIDVKYAIQRKFNITTAQHTLGVELHFED